MGDNLKQDAESVADEAVAMLRRFRSMYVEALARNREDVFILTDGLYAAAGDLLARIDGRADAPQA